jgi:hypothetical protein
VKGSSKYSLTLLFNSRYGQSLKQFRFIADKIDPGLFDQRYIHVDKIGWMFFKIGKSTYIKQPGKKLVCIVTSIIKILKKKFIMKFICEGTYGRYFI